MIFLFGKHDMYALLYRCIIADQAKYDTWGCALTLLILWRAGENANLFWILHISYRMRKISYFSMRILLLCIISPILLTSCIGKSPITPITPDTQWVQSGSIEIPTVTPSDISSGETIAPYTWAIETETETEISLTNTKTSSSADVDAAIDTSLQEIDKLLWN